MKSRYSWLLSGTLLGAASMAPAQYAGLYITEVITNPTIDEVVEIHNSTASPMDISGVVLTDAQSSNNEGAVKFPASTILAAGEVVVVALNTDAGEPAWLDTLPASVRVFHEPARSPAGWTAANGNTITAMIDYIVADGGTSANIALSATDNLALLQPTATFTNGVGVTDATLTIDGLNWDVDGPWGPINSTGQIDTAETTLEGNNQTDYPYHRSALVPNTNSWMTFVQDVRSVGVWAESNAAKIRNAPWYSREIGENAYARTYRFDSLFNSKQLIYVAELDQDTTGTTLKMPYRTGSARARTTVLASEVTGAAAAVNGNFFDLSGAIASVQYLKVDNVLISPTNNTGTQDDGGVVVDASGRVRTMNEPTATGDLGWETLTADPSIMATNISLVNAHKMTSVVLTGTFYTVDRHPRTAVGTTPDGKLLLVAVDGRTTLAAGMTLNEMSRMMIALGCDQAVNMDGGGSTTIWDRNLTGTGVANMPSDGSQRSVANALAAVAPASTTPTPAYDAHRAGGSVHSSVHTPVSVTVVSGNTTNISFSFVNQGTTTWTPATVFLGTSEPLDRVSTLYKASDWVSSSRATPLDQASVAPGATGTFTFSIDAPSVVVSTLMEESFSLVTNTGQWFGPEQSRLYLTVLTQGSADEIVVESRQLDGTKTPSPTYVEVGSFGDTTSKSTVTTPPNNAPLSAPGARYNTGVGSTGTFRPTLVQDGVYSIYVTMGAGSNNNANATYVIGNTGYSNVTGSVGLTFSDTTTLVNKWKLLQSNVPLTVGGSPYITFTNVDGNNGSGARFVMDAVRFSRTGSLSTVPGWYLY